MNREENLTQLRQVRKQIRELEPRVRNLVAQVGQADQARSSLRAQIQAVDAKLDTIARQYPDDPDPEYYSPEERACVERQRSELQKTRVELVNQLASVPGPDRLEVIKADAQLTNLKQAERNLQALFTVTYRARPVAL